MLSAIASLIWKGTNYVSSSAFDELTREIAHQNKVHVSHSRSLWTDTAMSTGCSAAYGDTAALTLTVTKTQRTTPRT
jgi:hypothetical protein